MSSIPFALVSRLCLIDAFFRRLSPSSFAAPLSLFPSRSRFVSRARYAPHLVSLEKSRFILLPTIPASIVFLYQPPLFYQRSPTFVASSLSRFNTHFYAFPLLSNSPPSRPLSRPFRHLASTSARPFLLHEPSLPLSFFLRLSNPRVSLFNVTLCAVASFSDHRALPLSITLSLSLSPSGYLPPTHAHPPPSSSAGSVRIGPAR